MSQLMTFSQEPITQSGTALRADACPPWCESGPHADGGPHFGGLFDIDLSLAEPGYVATADGCTPVSDFLDVALWQDPSEDRPVVGIKSGLDDTGLPDMTLSEAESLASALMDLVRRGRAAD